MIRRVIKIDEDRCDGCGLCVTACHEGAIELVDGKAQLMRDDYCDGLGNCLPACPTGAISFEEREADAFDEKAVAKHMANKKNQSEQVNPAPMPPVKPLACGCPGTHAKAIMRKQNTHLVEEQHGESETCSPPQSELNQWPVQIKLVPVNAPYFDNANLLIAADCTAFAYGNFHQKFMRNKITIIGCPKLDEGDYSEKLRAILQTNNIKSVTVIRMEVPCCAGIANATIEALKSCGKMIPWQVVTISTDGRILD